MGTAGAASSPNYFGDGSLGACQFGASAITQTGDSVTIDDVLSTGSESGGPGSNSYGGTNVPNTSACYELSVLNDSGYDGDMVVANFKDLTIDASVTLTTKETCRGLLCYVKGDCTINGALSMSARGGYSDPTSAGGSDSAVVNASGIQLGLVVDGASETLAAATFAGCGDAAVAAVANQDALDSNGTIFAISKAGGAGASSYFNASQYGQRANAGTNGATGANTISTAGGGSGGSFGNSTGGAGGAGGAFSAGPGSGAAMQQGGSTTSPGAGNYGAAGGSGSGNWGGAKGAGNPSGGGANHDGVGGIIWLLVDGDLTIGASGSIEADGSGGAVGQSNPGCGAAGSGGGAIFALYAGTLTNNGSIHSTFGQGGGNGGGSVTNGGNGGEGGIQTAQIDGS